MDPSDRSTCLYLLGPFFHWSIHEHQNPFQREGINVDHFCFWVDLTFLPEGGWRLNPQAWYKSKLKMPTTLSGCYLEICDRKARTPQYYQDLHRFLFALASPTSYRLGPVLSGKTLGATILQRKLGSCLSFYAVPGSNLEQLQDLMDHYRTESLWDEAASQFTTNPF